MSYINVIQYFGILINVYVKPIIKIQKLHALIGNANKKERKKIIINYWLINKPIAIFFIKLIFLNDFKKIFEIGYPGFNPGSSWSVNNNANL